MALKNIKQLLSENTYPGRGILAGLNADSKSLVLAYFIMGRSSNSRNRVFVEDGDGIRTQAHDPAKLEDPSLIIYAPVRVYGSGSGRVTIVTNGDQTDTVYDALSRGESFEQALRTRAFEPDEPNWTPRISCAASNGGYTLSILKSARGNGKSCERFFYEYASPVAGEGHLIHTYEHDANPLPSFSGEPRPVALSADIDALTAGIWESLNDENKVSLFVRYINLTDGTWDTRIINKNQ